MTPLRAATSSATETMLAAVGFATRSSWSRGRWSRRPAAHHKVLLSIFGKTGATSRTDLARLMRV